MADFSGRWKASEGDGRMIVRKLGQSADQSADDTHDAPVGHTCYCAVVAADGDSAIDMLEATLEQLEEVLNGCRSPEQLQQQITRFAQDAKHESDRKRLTVLAGMPDIEGEAIVGSFATVNSHETGDFAFVFQDENKFVGGLTSEPSHPHDGWWMRQNIRRTITIDGSQSGND